MAECVKCGAPVQTGSSLCEKCGGAAAPPGPRHEFDSVCGGCGALVPSGCAKCLVCGAVRGAVPFEGEFPVPSPAGKPHRHPRAAHSPNARRTPDVWRRWGGGVSTVLLLVFLSVAGLRVYRQYFDTSGYRADEAILYETESGRLLLTHPGLEQPREIAGVSRPREGYGEGQLCASSNGRRIAYTGGDGGLYLIDLAWRGGEAAIEAQKLAEGVAGAAVFSKNSDYLAYLTRTGELYASDLADVWQLDTGVAEMLAVSDRRVLYTRRGDRPGQTELFLNDLARDSGEWRLIGRGVTEVLDWTPGFERIFYTGVRQDAGGADTLALQLFEQAGGTTTTLASGVGRVLDASAEKGVAYYLIPLHQEWNLEMFVDDDLAVRDRRLREPELADYPLVQAAYAIYGVGGDFTDSADNEELIEESNRYQEALRAWEDKLARDSERQQLRELFDSFTDPVALYDLYLYQNGQAVLLDSGVLDSEGLAAESGAVDAAKNYVAYHRLQADSLRQMKMSALWEQPELQSPDLRDYYLRSTRQELRFSQSGGAPVRFWERGEDTRPYRWSVSPNTDGVYFTVAPDGRAAVFSALYYVPLRGGAVGDAVLVEREAQSGGWAFRDGMVFRAGRGGSRLYVVQGGSARPLGGLGALPFRPVNGGNTLLYLADYDEDSETGALHMLTREERFIAAGVRGCAYSSDELVYVYRAGSSRDRLDLYVWQGGREYLIEQDARAVLFPAVIENGIHLES